MHIFGVQISRFVDDSQDRDQGIPMQTSRLIQAPGTSRRWVLKAAAAAVLLPAAHSADAQIAISMAINRTARFRALSQRCAKVYCQLYLDVLPDNSRDVLAAAQRLIQVGFEDLAKGGFSTDISRQILAIQQEASALNALLASPAKRDSVATVSAQADKMLAVANRATESMESLSKQGSAKLVNVSGRQRMLSQRLAKNYFLAAAGHDQKPVREQLVSDQAEFKQALATLSAAPLSTNSIRNELALGQSQWTFFEAALHRKPDAEALRTVATTSERLLDVMNNLTGLYDAALRDLLGSA